MKFDEALERLSRKGHRITEARKRILKATLRQTKPFAAGDLMSADLDLVTIYRNLKAFEDAGLICRADFNDEMARYMVSEPGHDHHHHHIVCRRCQNVQTIDGCMLAALEKTLARKGFKQIQHRLEFSGLCPKCA
ncbi:MAG TPA: transcriptional repressor [Bdellovibrionales bacterium]|nr:transcriptional repressor [Bdellovibrionales bacterium]